MQCCASYQVCSREGICVNKNDYSKLCTYRKLLEKGINYFKVNESFMVIQARLFHIGKKRSYNNDTQPLRKDEREFLKEVFARKGIELVERMTLERCIEEKTSDHDRAICKVVLTIGEEQYNIHNFNGRALTEKTAIEIRKTFIDMSFGAAIVYVGKKALSVLPSDIPIKTEAKIVYKLAKENSAQVEEILPNQISMDEFLKTVI